MRALLQTADPVLDEVRRLDARGFRLWPIIRATKKPAIDGFAAEDGLVTLGLYPERFDGREIAVLTGPYSATSKAALVCIDFDGQDVPSEIDGVPFPATLTSKGGRHRWYIDTTGTVTQLVGWRSKVDVKAGLGAYAIETKNGLPLWDNPADLPVELTPELLAMLPKGKRAAAVKGGGSDEGLGDLVSSAVGNREPDFRLALALARAVIADWPSQEQGGHHDACFKLFGALRYGDVSPEWAFDFGRRFVFGRCRNPQDAAEQCRNAYAEGKSGVRPETAGAVLGEAVADALGLLGWPGGGSVQRRKDDRAAWSAFLASFRPANDPEPQATPAAAAPVDDPLEQEPDQDRNTDAGNARAFELRYGDELRYCAPLRTWFRWDGQHWKPDAKGDVMKRGKAFVRNMFEVAGRLEDREHSKEAFKWAYKSSSVAGLNALVELAKTEGRIPIAVDELDADPYLLNVQNGIVDLRTGKLLPHSPAALCTKIAGAAYIEGARSDTWDAALKTWTGGDATLATYLQNVVGYAAVGAWSEKSFWYLYGPPDGGKSAFLSALGHVFGTYHAAADVSTWAPQQPGGNRGDLVRLRGARLVTTVEIKRGMRFDEALLKKVSGGDLLTAAAKYKDDIEWLANFALMFAANDRMKVHEDEDGVWSRLQCVPFDHPIPKARQDKGLGRKLATADESAAVLAWVVEGARRYLAQAGCGAVPERVTNAGAEYQKAMNPALEFLTECCEFGADFEVTSSALTAALDTWKRGRAGGKATTHTKLGEALKDRGCVSIKIGTHTREYDARVKGWRGVRLFEL